MLFYLIPEGFTENDKTLMKAKINFTATAVGSHPNVLKFIGAVVDDTACKFNKQKSRFFYINNAAMKYEVMYDAKAVNK